MIPRRLNSMCRRFGTLCSFVKGRVDKKNHYSCHRSCEQKESSCPHDLWRLNRQNVPKRRYIKFRRRGKIQKKEYNTTRRKFETKKDYNSSRLSGSENTVLGLQEDLQTVLLASSSLRGFSLHRRDRDKDRYFTDSSTSSNYSRGLTKAWDTSEDNT
jgi:hypothetical protein